MTRGRDHAYVRQAVHDLLGLHTPRRTRAVEPPPGGLPVGVAARLALVWAAVQDRSLLTAGAPRGEAAKHARARLLDDAVQAGRNVDLLHPVVLPVRCGRAVHRVRLTADGDVESCAHPALDADSERIAAALGGALLPCLRVADGSALRWSPPVADDGPRLLPVEAGELLAFVRLARTWLGRGFDLLDCAAALDQGVRHDEVSAHLDLGLPVEAAVSWRGVPPDVAMRWDVAGFRREDADLWVQQGRTIEEAEVAARAAGDGRWLVRWARIVGDRLPADALGEWAAFGMPVGVWGEAASRGLRAAEVPAWLSAGFQPVEVLRYAHLRVPLEEAVRWQRAGFTGYVATGCLGVGMTLEDACALRGLPAKQVQELWRDCPSVAAVLERCDAAARATAPL